MELKELISVIQITLKHVNMRILSFYWLADGLLYATFVTGMRIVRFSVQGSGLDPW